MINLAKAKSFLDHTQDAFVSLSSVGPEVQWADIVAPLGQLIEQLQSWKDASSHEEWVALCEACIRHPLRRTMHQDPLTARAFFKPRTYAGDAGIIDLLYRHAWSDPLLGATTPLGRAIYEQISTQGAMSRGIRERRRIASEAIDATAQRVAKPNILSVACGHLREAESSSAAQARRLGRFVGFDQDDESLGEVTRAYGALGVECVQGKINAFFDGTSQLPKDFDLVYSTGLYDYLDESIGTRLTAALFTHLRPGGSLYIANLLVGSNVVGYAESFMDWHLVFRDHHDLFGLAAEIPAAEIASTEIIEEPNGCVAFLRLTKS